jgi:hypothetical protein
MKTQSNSHQALRTILSLKTATPTPPAIHDKFKGNATELVKGLVKAGLNNEVNGARRGHHEVLAPAQLIPLESQRNTTEAWVKKVLKQSGGFDRVAAGLIQIARTPNGDNLVWDGCGRLALAQATSVADLDCWVVDLTPEEAAHYFVYVQKTSNRSLKPGELFINGYKTGAPEYVAFAETLKRLGMRIQGADDYWVPRVSLADRHLYPEVRERGVRQALKYGSLSTQEVCAPKFAKKHLETIQGMTAEDFVRFARDTIVQAGWNDDTVRQDLLPALVLVYKCYPELLVNGYNTNFRAYFHSLAGNVYQGKLQFKQMGGNKHNQESKSVAFGIIKGFRASPSCKTNQGGVITEKRIAEFLGKDFDTEEEGDE